VVPLVLVAKGHPISESLLYTGLTYLGYPVGSVLSLPLVEAVERKHVIASGLAMAVFGLAFGFSNSRLLILVFGFLYTAVSNLFSNAYHIYQAEIFPTSMRSTGASGTYALSRLVTAVKPFVLVPVLNDGGVGALFAIVSAAMIVVVIDVSVLGPRTTGRRLLKA
jgi:putative MFS transporter